MKAAVFNKYGSPDELHISEVEKPVPEENELLIRIKAASVTAGDCEIRRFDISPLFWIPIRLFTGLFRPRIKILGQELSGVVETVGSKVTKFKVGDEIFCPTNMNLGAHAEYITLPENSEIAIKPRNVSFNEAAAISVGGLNAIHFLKLANIKPGEKILINGAGGTIGSFAVQVAKLYNANITAVDSADKSEMLFELGADNFIDYKKSDVTKSSNKYDVIFDMSGDTFITPYLKILNKGGKLLIATPSFISMIMGQITSLVTNKKVFTKIAAYSLKELNELARLTSEKKIKVWIDKTFELVQISEAHRYVESGKKGSVIISIDPENLLF